MALVVVFQQLPGCHVEGLCYGASELAGRPLAAGFHEKPRAQIKQQRGGNVAALLMDIRGIERLGIYRRAAGHISRGAGGKVCPGTCGNGRSGRGMGFRPGGAALGAAESLVGAREWAGRQDGSLRDGQLAAVVELEHQLIGQHRQDSRYPHPAPRALQRDFIPRASFQVKTRGHDPSAGEWHTSAQSQGQAGHCECAGLTLPRRPPGRPCLTLRPTIQARRSTLVADP